MELKYFRPDTDNVKLAHAYIPFQRYSSKYSLNEALNKGTLYPALYMPYKQGTRGYY